VIFPEDSTKWGPRSRYLRVTQVHADGSFQIVGMPPSERYLADATNYLEDGEHTDPDFLTVVRDMAVPFSLDDGEARRIELRLIPR